MDFLQIQLKLYQQVKKVQTSNYDDTIETITSLITKPNGEPLNNDMAQVLQLLKNSKEKFSSDCKKIVKEYKNELARHGIQDHSIQYLTWDSISDKK